MRRQGIIVYHRSSVVVIVLSSLSYSTIIPERENKIKIKFYFYFGNSLRNNCFTTDPPTLQEVASCKVGCFMSVLDCRYRTLQIQLQIQFYSNLATNLLYRHVTNIPMFFLFCFAGPNGHSSFSVLPGLRSSSAHCLLNILSAFLMLSGLCVLSA